MVIIISHFPSVCLWTVQAPMAITVCFIYIHACKHGDKNRHTHTVLPSVLLAGHMLYFSLACYINRAVVYSGNTLFHWSLLSYPGVSKGQRTATPNAIMTDIIIFRVSISHFQSDTTTSSFPSLCSVPMTFQGRLQVQFGRSRVGVSGTASPFSKQRGKGKKV